MICIRENIFETNSSSTHSVCVNFKKLINIDSFDNLVIEGNKCIITAINQMDDFGKWQPVRGERDKLNYLFTWMYIRDTDLYVTGESYPDAVYWPESYGGIYTGLSEEQYKNLLSAIQKKYPKVEGISFLNPKNAEFDHQTSPWEEDDFIIDLDDTNEIYNYLFNNHLYIQIGHD